MAQQNTPIDLTKVKWDEPPAIDPSKVKWDVPAGDLATSFGRGAASLIDNTLGGIAPMAVQQFSYPFLRLGSNMNAEQAQKESERLASYVDKPVGKAFGVTETPEYKNEASNAVMQFIAENLHKGAAWAAEKTGLPESDVVNMAGSLMMGAPKAIKAATPILDDTARAAVATAKDTGNAIAAQIAEIPGVRERANKAWDAKVRQSWGTAAKQEGAELARKHDILVDTSVTNPTVGNRMVGHVVGAGDQQTRMAQANAPRFNNVVLKDLNVPGQPPVLSPEYFAAAQAAPDVSVPYNRVRSIPQVELPSDTASRLNGLKPEPIPGAKNDAAGVAKFIDNLVTDLNEPLSGDTLLKTVQDYRQKARDIQQSVNAGQRMSEGDRALARAYAGVADILEDGITASLKDPVARAEFDAARARRAQIFAYERATNPLTGQFDPRVLADEAKNGAKLTGVPLELAKIAENNRLTSNIDAHGHNIALRLTRAGLPGAVGAILGGVATGGAPMGVAIGTAAGAGMGELARLTLAKYARSAHFQDANAIPFDYRTAPHPINSLTPPAAPIPPVNALVTRGSPFAEQSAERVAAYREQAAQEAAGLAAEQAAPRAPTTGGQVLNFGQEGALEYNPYTRTFAPPTPTPQIITSTRNLPPESPSSLWTAADKLASHPASNQFPSRLESLRGAPTSQPFNLTAAEKVAWDKTRVDLAEVLPGMNALDPKQIAERMMDRQWVADAVQKARDKAAAFARIESRAKDAQSVREARAARERMMDLAESLEEGLRRPRAGTGVPKEQGPRTKAAIRKNNLAPENKNHLAR